MIFDTINNASQYFALHPHFSTAFRWLQNNPNAEEGRYEIIGDDCFVMIQAPLARGKDDPILEAHNEYIDIQITLEGDEELGWKARRNCNNVTQEYSSDNDAILWSDTPDFYLKAAPGHFAIFFPEDAHAPLSGSGQLKKAVFKVRTLR